MPGRNELVAFAIILAIVFAGVFVYYFPSTEHEQKPVESDFEDTLIKQPEVNIASVVSVVTAKKPAEIVASFAGESSSNKEGTELTIYNQDLALVKEFRNLELENGLNLVRYEDIAKQIKADSVLFTDLTDPNAFVVEQNYEYDLVSLEKLLQKYIDKVITVQAPDDNIFIGRLLSYDSSGLVLESEGKIIAIKEAKRIEFPELPEGLLTKPTLVWKLYTEQAGLHRTQTSYLTSGISWEASYVARVNASDSRAELTGWVTINNKSGTSYPNTSLKLIAGELHLVKPEEEYYRKLPYESVGAAPTPEQFEEEALFEYHMYTLERKTDIKNNETKQISLLKAESIPLKKEYVFDTGTSYYWQKNESNKVKVMVSFKNAEENGLGVPLPKGTVRVYKEDSRGMLQFVGEDSIEHTPKDEEVRLFLGYAFDIVAEKKTTDEERIGDKCVRKSYEVDIRNHKDESITVIVVQKAWGENEIVRSSHSYKQKDAYTYEFEVPVEANGEATLTYTIMSCW